jgi:CRP/FNR family transcriptional regulator
LNAQQQRELPNVMACTDPVPAGTHLYRAGDPVGSQFHIRSVMVKTYAIGAEGDEWVTGFHLPGDVIGIVHADGLHTESAVTLETCSTCLLPEASVPEDANVTRALLRHLGEKSRLQQMHQLSLRQSSAEVRAAAFCVHLSARLERLGRNSAYLPTPMSRTDIASFIGMSLESLSRVLSKLSAAGVVDAQRDHIEILQMDTLKAVALPTMV